MILSFPLRKTETFPYNTWEIFNLIYTAVWNLIL